MNPSQHNSAQQEKIGIILRILSGIAFTIMGAFIKYLAETVPLGQVVFFRSAFALIPLVGFMLWQRDFPNALKTTRPMGHLLRCAIGTVAMFTAFATLRYLPLAEATTLTYLSPIILVILAVLVLKESVSYRRWQGVILGLFGLLVMTVPNFSVTANFTTLIGIGLGVLTAILIASALLQVRHLTLQGEKTATITFYFAVASTIIGAITAIGGWIQPTFSQWLCLISIGVVGGIAQLLMTLSFSYASASALAAYEYLAILWALLVGILFFDEIPGTYFWLAVPLILAGAIVAKPAKR